jgi:oligopeptide/dipeptide ABC transporter ATP-binding protein
MSADSSTGELPNPAAPPPGCPFAPRCPQVEQRCHAAPPAMASIGATHQVACHLIEPGG